MAAVGMVTISLLYLAIGGLSPFAAAPPAPAPQVEPSQSTEPSPGAGAPSPSSVPSPAPSSSSSSSSSALGELSLIKRVPTPEGGIAITFNACATRTQGYGFDRGIFDVLKREGVPATIFVSGRWVETHPGEMAELVADPQIEFGDHTYDHPHMSRLTPVRMAEEIDQTEAALGRFGKRSVAFRPPFGDWNRILLQVVQGKQLPAVLWDVVSGDPAASTTSAGMIRTVLRGTRPGSILIFHINGRGTKTAESLPAIIHELRARGFKFVQLSQLLAASALPLPAPRPSIEPPPFASEPRAGGRAAGGAMPTQVVR